MITRAEAATVLSAIVILLSALPNSVGQTSSSGAPGLVAGFKSPVRIARNNKGNFLVSDHAQRCIVELKRRDLSVVRSFEIPGKLLAVAWLSNKVYVGNETNHSVEVYTKTGDFLHDLGGAGAFQQPTDIATDTANDLVFVVDGQLKVVKIFDVSSVATGVLVGQIPPTGPDPSILANPTGIALDLARSEILVSDFGDPAVSVSASIRIFDYQGNAMGIISGKMGMLGKRFSRPQGLAVKGDHVFMVDSWIGRAMIFDRLTGAQVGSLGTYGTNPGELSLPLDLVIDPGTDDVFITNNRLGRIERFVDGAIVP